MQRVHVRDNEEIPRIFEGKIPNVYGILLLSILD